MVTLKLNIGDLCCTVFVGFLTYWKISTVNCTLNCHYASIYVYIVCIFRILSMSILFPSFLANSFRLQPTNDQPEPDPFTKSTHHPNLHLAFHSFLVTVKALCLAAKRCWDNFFWGKENLNFSNFQARFHCNVQDNKNNKSSCRKSWSVFLSFTSCIIEIHVVVVLWLKKLNHLPSCYQTLLKLSWTHLTLCTMS